MAVRITGAGVALTVGIIVVTGLIIAGLFYARQTGDQARRDEAAKIAEQNQEQQEGGDVALNEGDTANESENGSESNNGSESTDEGSSEGAGNGSSEGSTSGSGSTDSSEASQGQNIPTTGPTSTESVEELPRTGGGDIFANVVAVGGLTFAVAAYVVSRKALQGVR